MGNRCRVFGDLTTVTFSTPLFDICIQTRPKTAAAYKLSGALCPLVAMVLMQQFQDFLPEGCRQEEL
jgi:hypothetical protein